MSPAFLLFTVHIKVAYKGVIVSFMSWPCKHKPAYNLSESLQPKPANSAPFLVNIAYAILTILGPDDPI